MIHRSNAAEGLVSKSMPYHFGTARSVIRHTQTGPSNFAALEPRKQNFSQTQADFK